MQLQLALDGTLIDSLNILTQVHPFIDIIEVGTPLIYREGINAIQVIHDAYPQKPILADLKIMDAGEEEAGIAYVAGASLVTVLGVTSDMTILGVMNAARQHKGQVVVDMIQVNDKERRGHHLIEMGCDYLCIHTAHDRQHFGDSPYKSLKQLRTHLPEAALAVAGGIKAENVDHYVALNPAIIVSGGGITKAVNPTLAAQTIKEKMSSAESSNS